MRIYRGAHLPLPSCLPSVATFRLCEGLDVCEAQRMRTAHLALLPGLLVPVFLFASCGESTPGLDGGPARGDSALGNAPDGFVNPNDPVAQCQTVGGAITQIRCCKTAQDFPDQCKAGACACDEADLKETTICTCPGDDLCWNGKRCLPR